MGGCVSEARERADGWSRADGMRPSVGALGAHEATGAPGELVPGALMPLDPNPEAHFLLTHQLFGMRGALVCAYFGEEVGAGAT